MSGKRIVQTDSVFEATLGLVLLGGAAIGRLGPDDFPAPVGTAAIVVAGCALLGVAAVLWRLAEAPHLLRTLAAANLATAVAACTWRLVATGFSTAGTALTLGTAVALTVLAAAQFSTDR